ncbi:TIGR03943 family putative permease subunit [Marinisporobacter balticus]|uniref:Putative membrane protein n=1 Tax=Marinisporobacter balticus TaxID=2018667 RepID=A0A4R2KNW4_9FIRM|nr:TIGR03943 family protein [Marinisporobacter balticus]TCO68275.1 putative membrane protein [Marinisporobacter balticus]
MKRFNINELIWFIILISFPYYIYKLFATGEINIYMNPKMFKYVLFSFCVFVLLSIFQIRRIFNSNKVKKIKLGYIIFIIPLFLAFVVNPDRLNARIVSNKGVSIVDNNSDNRGKSIINNNEDSIQIDINTNSDRINNLDAEKFRDTLENVYVNLDSMMGEEVELSGFIYRELDFSTNRFVISRLLMSCCAADAQVTGLLCEWDEGSKLQDNVWIKVTGIIDSTTHYNKYTEKEETIPLIKVIKVESIKPPKDQYIYP